MGFLNETGVIRWHFRRIFGGPGGRAIVAAGHRDANQSNVVGSLESGDDIGGLAARAQTQGDVSRLSVRLNLPCKNFLVRVVVPDSGEGARVAAEADSGQGSAISHEAAYEFAREVHGECGAPPVAEGDNFPFGHQAFDDDAGDIVYLPGVVARG